MKKIWNKCKGFIIGMFRIILIVVGMIAAIVFIVASSAPC